VSTGPRRGRRLPRPAPRDDGASAVEYAILAGFIAAVAAAALFGIGQLVLVFFGLGEGAFD
jgi:Flp pilus assembly pilin Flp